MNGRSHQGLDTCGRIAADIVVIHEIGCCANEDEGFGSTAHGERRIGQRLLAVAELHTGLGLHLDYTLHAFVVTATTCHHQSI